MMEDVAAREGQAKKQVGTAWRPWFSFKLGFKILVPVLLACLVSAVLLAALFSWQMSRQASEDLTSRLNAFAASKAAELSGPVWEFREDMVHKLMFSYSHNDDLLQATLFDHDGKVVLQVRNKEASGYSKIHKTSKKLVHVSGDETHALGRLEVEYHNGRVANFLNQRLVENTLVIVLVLLVLALSIWLSIHIIVGRPLLKLKQSLGENLRNKDLQPLHWSSDDELGDVVDAYNDLVGELDLQKKRLESMNTALRDEAEQRLKAEKDLQLAARIFDVSIEGIAIADDKGNIRNVNESFESITGFAAREVVGRNLRDVKSGVGDADIHETIWKHVNAEGHWSGDIWNSRKNGEQYAERLTLFRMADESGAANYQVAVFHEITERKRAEQALKRSRDEFERQVALRTTELRQANEKLMEMDQLRSAFLSSASHELRTPLTSVLGFVKLVKRDFRRSLSGLEDEKDHSTAYGDARVALRIKTERILHNLNIIEHEGARLTRLVDDLLDLNKIESGRMEWRDEELDPAEEVNFAVQALSMAEDISGLSFVQHAEENLPKLFMDSDRFRQILINLLGNAVKFTDKGTVAVDVIQPVPGIVRVSVKDSGVGIEPENLERIFQRFFQGNGQEKDKPKGTGLGLAICKNIVEHYQGRIWAESAPGEGSTFIFEIPAR